MSDVVKTYIYYPKYISTLILCDYIAKHTSINSEIKDIHNFTIDDLFFTCRLSEGYNNVLEAVVEKNGELYDYFCVNYVDPEIKPNEII